MEPLNCKEVPLVSEVKVSPVVIAILKLPLSIPKLILIGSVEVPLTCNPVTGIGLFTTALRLLAPTILNRGTLGSTVELGAVTTGLTGESLEARAVR